MTVKKSRDEDLNYEDEIILYHRLGYLDSKEHIESETCWCEPQLVYKNPENGNEVWLHNLLQ
jgi:hypothetical protein